MTGNGWVLIAEKCFKAGNKTTSLGTRSQHEVKRCKANLGFGSRIKISKIYISHLITKWKVWLYDDMWLNSRVEIKGIKMYMTGESKTRIRALIFLKYVLFGFVLISSSFCTYPQSQRNSSFRLITKWTLIPCALSLRLTCLWWQPLQLCQLTVHTLNRELFCYLLSVCSI